MWRFIDESTSEMKKLLVANGVRKFPSGMRFLDNRADWEKSNGYAGRKTLDAIHQQIEDAGWTEGDSSSGISPDGSSAGNGDKYTSPDGRIVASMYSYYGCTSCDNSFSITFKLIG